MSVEKRISFYYPHILLQNNNLPFKGDYCRILTLNIQKSLTSDCSQIRLYFVLGDVLLSQDPAVQVPSALEGLTVVFGMGTRGSLPPSPPNVTLVQDVACVLKTGSNE